MFVTNRVNYCGIKSVWFLSTDDELVFLASAGIQEGESVSETQILRHQLLTAPMLTRSAMQHHIEAFPLRGLLGVTGEDRMYYNTNAPGSTVICGVQVSAKIFIHALSHTIGVRAQGRVTLAAFLSMSAPHIESVTPPRITVLCSPSNITRRRQAYAALPEVRVEPLCLSEKDLTANRMLAIMGCDNLDALFKTKLDSERLDNTQRAMIKLRMNLLDGFIDSSAPQLEAYFAAGGLVLIDLTDPFLDGVTAALFFDIVLGSFTQWRADCGKLVVLDEAHKYLTNDNAARLTQSLSNIIRLQRHLGIRVVVATQEPTVVPETILDLSSIIICHRFSSPAWCTYLARHVACSKDGADSGLAATWFERVMSLRTGHALLFCPAAVMEVKHEGNGCVLLGSDCVGLCVRPRLTMDGGTSVLAAST
ncbi:p-loop containing nucleoside triphosphate hydrolase protein [Favolaschia claudopus]|uniref:P-loop containing nucleoside triphosphate hydrolase protein n=1 Tax=Favolaschia claudopus TaxID=2862362 RepID=A0AAV9Z223_9AGAR